MAKMRMSMRKTKEILRLKWEGLLSNRQIARSCQVSPGTVWKYLCRASAHQLNWNIVEAILASRRHPEQGYKSTLGILRLEKKAGVGRERLEKAAERALRFRSYSFRSVKNILERGLDRHTQEALPMNLALPLHNNIRGSHYYEKTEGGQENA